MTISQVRKQWSDDELLAMPRDGRKREIVGGELVIMSPAGFDRGALINRLVHALGVVIYRDALGELADGQTGFRLDSGDVFSPDLAFVSQARIDQRSRDPQATAFFQGAPDLFVEVLSPSDTVEVLQEKLDQFFRQGARLAWIIHPRKACVYVYHAPEAFTTLHRQDSLDGENLIPGFRLPLTRLFP